MNAQPKPNPRGGTLPFTAGLLILFLPVAFWSAIQPHDRFTWWMEIFPVLLAVPILLATFRRFPLTRLAYLLIFWHATILFIGGHYTYARVPAFDWLKEIFHFKRNHFDRLGHFAQGFVPALLAREILLRNQIVRGRKWLAFIVVAICLAISVCYEFIEWWTALLTGSAATDFLGTQGDPWDTQEDMFMALIGAVTCLSLLTREHDRQIAALTAPESNGSTRRAISTALLALGFASASLWSMSAAEPAASTMASSNSAAVQQLGRELHDKGWIVYSAKTTRGDWDLFLMRPDGSDRRKITDTAEFSETGPRFSPDGATLLYYRQPKSDPVDNNTYGLFDLVIADSNGKRPQFLGRGYPWASWSPDGRQLACLSPKGIQIIDIASRQQVRQFARRGIVQQLVWAPDGSSFVGAANGLGMFWNIGRLNPDTGEIIAISETDRYNCTPDWTPDSKHIVYSRGIIPKQGGRAELWCATADGQSKRMIYAEAGRHIYGSCASPDGNFVLFTRSVEDLGKVDQSETTMAIIRWRDTPMIGDASLRERFPNANLGPRLDLGPGWEPHWTLKDSPSK